LEESDYRQSPNVNAGKVRNLAEGGYLCRPAAPISLAHQRFHLAQLGHDLRGREGLFRIPFCIQSLCSTGTKSPVRS
jgi:hypothetical protein